MMTCSLVMLIAGWLGRVVAEIIVVSGLAEVRVSGLLMLSCWV